MSQDNPLNSPWVVSPQIPRGPTGAIQAAEWTLGRLRQLGVPVPAGNRLQMAKRLLEDVNSGRATLFPEDEVLLRRVAEAQRSIEEQYIIVKAAGNRSGQITALLREKLAEMLSGAELEEDDKNHLGRNTQFELYVGAMLTMGGASITHAEPDLKMLFINSKSVGVAAKRLSSQKQLRRRMQDGIEQIQGSGMHGFIAVNMDVFLKNARIHPDEAQRGPQYNREITALHRLREEMEWPREVLGVMNFGTMVEWEVGGEKPRLGMHRFRQFWWYPENDDERSKYDIFFNRLSRVIEERMANL